MGAHVSKHTTHLRRVLLGLMVVGLAVLTVGGPVERADAFGTVYIPFIGQRVVHEKITRVLSCTSTQKPENCFEPMSMSMLAGTNGTFGAVGEPDNPLDGNPNPAARHCDDADHGYGSPHSQQEAWAELSKCLDYYQQYMGFAVSAAGRLLRPDGTIEPAAVGQPNAFGTAYNSCKLPDPIKGARSTDTAKCDVINAFGRALHLYEDFWSHSNWGDVAAPDRPASLTNPAGLGRSDQPEFFAFPAPVATSFPDGLITGCDDSLSSRRCKGRTGHSALNKDNGETVDPDRCTVKSPITARAQVVVDRTSNFQRATTGACGAALRAWSDLRAALVATYGPANAAMMIRAIVSDAPLTGCRLSGAAAQALTPPVGDQPAERSVDVTVVNQTGAAFSCKDAVLDGGVWSSHPADGVTPAGAASWRTQVQTTVGSIEGAVRYGIDGTGSDVVVTWHDPSIGSGEPSCEVGPGFVCTWNDDVGDASVLTFTVAPV
jgi:hypothetical protein